jgi:hypothetical protein
MEATRAEVNQRVVLVLDSCMGARSVFLKIILRKILNFNSVSVILGRIKDFVLIGLRKRLFRIDVFTIYLLRLRAIQ